MQLQEADERNFSTLIVQHATGEGLGAEETTGAEDEEAEHTTVRMERESQQLSSSPGRADMTASVGCDLTGDHEATSATLDNTPPDST